MSILSEVLNGIDPTLSEKVITGLCAKYEALLQQAYKQPYINAADNRMACSNIENLFFIAQLPIKRLHEVAVKVQKQNTK